jgi:sterol desaturase/sphingolipid hydroxylase (fatty acid hydroxylase superfamily)
MLPDDSLLKQTWSQAALGQLITNPIGLVPVYYAFKYFGSPSINSPLPDFTTVYTYFFIAEVFDGWGFYWGHRLLHSVKFYSSVHK